MAESGAVPCPYCAELIHAAAVKCRFCGEFVKHAPAPIRPRKVYRPPESEATTILVLGILGLVLCGICGIFAWVKGNNYIRQCRIYKVAPSGSAVAGRVLGMITSILIFVQIAVVLLMLGVVGSRSH